MPIIDDTSDKVADFLQLFWEKLSLSSGNAGVKTFEADEGGESILFDDLEGEMECGSAHRHGFDIVDEVLETGGAVVKIIISSELLLLNHIFDCLPGEYFLHTG